MYICDYCGKLIDIKTADISYTKTNKAYIFCETCLEKWEKNKLNPSEEE